MNLYTLAKTIISSFLHTYHRVHVIGLENIPKEGSLVIVGNHVSILDPLYIGAICPRKVHYMAKKEAFRSKYLAKTLYALGTFPVDREKPEMKTMRHALSLLQSGEVLGLFPEGGRKKEDSLQELKQGAAYFAIKSNCPVLPIYIKGTESALPKGSFFIRPKQVQISIGHLIYPRTVSSLKEEQQYLSEQMMDQLHQLQNSKAAG